MKPSPRLIIALIGVIVVALFITYRLLRPPEMPKIAPGSNARTVDAPDH